MTTFPTAKSAAPTKFAVDVEKVVVAALNVLVEPNTIAEASKEAAVEVTASL